MEDYELTKNERGLLYYIRENQRSISALSTRLDELEKLIASFNGSLPPLELVHHEGKWMTLDDFLKSRGN
jgi:hypothetical protein